MSDLTTSSTSRTFFVGFQLLSYLSQLGLHLLADLSLFVHVRVQYLGFKPDFRRLEWVIVEVARELEEAAGIGGGIGSEEENVPLDAGVGTADLEPFEWGLRELVELLQGSLRRLGLHL